ncbi:related to 2-dehydropantoate 2-reductase family protein [Rhynchosporium agropyri]|uniref:Related to 2-dehydropantoate 2-reductase family protein n=1 Tax=Rhynchosporium agropyri TaxID=914238 RepID=A0A1E1K5F4_9HELO|nr:related to 2-dehydropantoate 2-reductase family protein [Rhynchosporium agropyri]
MATFLSPGPTRPSTATQEAEKEFNICLVGSGGVGTIAALTLEKSGRAKVTVVVRGSYGVVSEKGFDIESVDHGDLKGWKPSRIASSIEEAAFAPRSHHSLHIPTGAATPMESPRERYDFLVLCSKQLPDKYSLAAMVSPLITPGYTTIVLMQNGLFIHVPFTTQFPQNVIISAVSMIGVFTEGSNKIKQIGSDLLQIGAHYHSGVTDSVSSQRTQTFFDMYSSGGAKSCVLAPDMMQTRYAQLLWNAPYNCLCALMGMTVGEIQRSGAREKLVEPMMREILAIAKADGIVLTENLMHEMLYRNSETSRWRPSMMLDREQGRPMEVEVNLGDVIRKGKELGVEAKVMESVYDLLCLVRWRSDNPVDGGEAHIG